MASKRKEIRIEVVALLSVSGSVVWNSQDVPIYNSRAIPFWTVQLPAVAVYTLEESADHEETAPREYKRKLQLVTQIIAEIPDSGSIDDMLDDIAEQIELVLFKNQIINNKADDSYLINTTINHRDEGEKLFAAASLIWEIEYRTDAPPALGPPDVEDLDTSNIQIGVDRSETPEAGKTIDAEVEHTP